MNIVINGGGGVGQALASILSEEQHDVTVIELNPSRAEAVREIVDCRVVAGAGAMPSVLRDASADESDIFIAVTDHDEVNLLSCLIARKLGAPRSIARVVHPCFSTDDPAVPVSELGIDQIINPDEEAARETVRLLHNPVATEIIPLAEGAVNVAGMIVEPGSVFDGSTLADLPGLSGGMRYCVAFIRRGKGSIIPGGRDKIEAGDEIFIIATPEAVKQIGTMVNPGAGANRLSRVMVFGATGLGKDVAGMLQNSCKVTMVDIDGQAENLVSKELSKTLVIAGSGRDMDLLQREGLSENDAFVAVTDDEATNLIGCLYAKKLGVPRTIARIEREFYRPLMMTAGVDAAVSARQTTINAILKYIRPGDIKSVARMRGISAEAMELTPCAGAKILDKPLHKIRFPRGAIVGMVVKPDGVVVPSGETCIHQKDRAIVFTLQKAAKDVQNLFS